MSVKILPPMPGPANKRVVAVAYDGLCLFEYGVATELFALERPELGLDWYRFEAVSPDPGPLRATGGVTLEASTDLRRIARAGTVVLPAEVSTAPWSTYRTSGCTSIAG